MILIVSNLKSTLSGDTTRLIIKGCRPNQLKNYGILVTGQPETPPIISTNGIPQDTGKGVASNETVAKTYDGNMATEQTENTANNDSNMAAEQTESTLELTNINLDRGSGDTINLRG